MRNVVSRLVKIWFTAICVSASFLFGFGGGDVWAQTASYRLQMETGQGLTVVTFSTDRAEAKVYLPDDLGPGESFSGSLEGPRNYTVEFANQIAGAGQGLVHWKMPAGNAGEFVAFILKDARGREVARAWVPVVVPAAGPSRTPETQVSKFRFPRFVQARTPAPVLGSFDGDAETSIITMDAKPALILAESVRKATVLCPDVTGVVDYTVAKGALTANGQTRSLDIHAIGTNATSTNAATAGVSITGLQGLKEDIPFDMDGQYFFVQPTNVSKNGTYSSASLSREKLRLIFPQNPADDVSLILHLPGKDPNEDLSKARAQALRRLDFDAMPVLAGFLADRDLGGDAAYAMLALDERQALPFLFASMPASGANIQRIGFGWFLGRFGFPEVAGSRADAHEAALRVLSRPRPSSTESAALALHALGFTGTAEDFPLLEKNYQHRSDFPGLEPIQDASEAALARLGSREHADRIRTEVTAALPGKPTPAQSTAAARALQKAGYSGLLEMIPAVCSHLNDPTVLEIDITWDSKFSALAALNAIVNKTSPIAKPSKSMDEWKAYCAAR